MESHTEGQRPINLNFNIEWKMEDIDIIELCDMRNKSDSDAPLNLAITWTDKEGLPHYVIKKNCKITSKYNPAKEIEEVMISEV